MDELDRLLREEWQDEPSTVTKIVIQNPPPLPPKPVPSNLKKSISAVVLAILGAVHIAKEFGLLD